MNILEIIISILFLVIICSLFFYYRYIINKLRNNIDYITTYINSVDTKFNNFKLSTIESYQQTRNNLLYDISIFKNNISTVLNNRVDQYIIDISTYQWYKEDISIMFSKRYDQLALLLISQDMKIEDLSNNIKNIEDNLQDVKIDMMYYKNDVNSYKIDIMNFYYLNASLYKLENKYNLLTYQIKDLQDIIITNNLNTNTSEETNNDIIDTDNAVLTYTTEEIDKQYKEISQYTKRKPILVGDNGITINFTNNKK